MKANTYDYFLNLDKMKLKRENGKIIIPKDISGDLDVEYNFTLAGRKFHSKYEILGGQPIATCNLFHNSGILTPPIYLVGQKGNENTFQICEDVHRPQFTECVEPQETLEYDQFFRHQFDINNTWDFLYNPSIIEYFLTFMTSECLTQLISLFAVDNLRSEQDRHTCNYFLYKLPGSNKFNGIIAIDHDLTELDEFCSCYTANKDKFNDIFLKREFLSYSPVGGIVVSTHETNIGNLRTAIYDGLLPLTAILSLKDALNYDFPGQIKKVGEKYHSEDEGYTNLYDGACRLWEYNRHELEDVLDSY